MFKIESLINEINKIVHEKKNETRNKNELIDILVEILFQVQPDLIRNFNKKSIPYTFATPCSKISRGIRTKKIDTDYSIVAADGSIIPINEDFYFPYFVINTGFAYIKYGKQHQFQADSSPQIYYREDEIYENYQGIKQLVKGESLSSKMLLKESLKVEELIRNYSQANFPLVALIDGTLIQWEIKSKTDDFVRTFIGDFEHLFKTSEQLNIPLGGYISGTRSMDVLGTINLYAAIKGFEINLSNKNQNSIALDEHILSLIFDRDLFSRLLGKGERSTLFMSNEQILDFYSKPVYFFFLNANEEIVRIEVPEFVAKDEKKLNTLHSVLLSQIEKGPNYPVVLREAHEQAVIHNSEKRALEDIITELLFKNNLEYKENSKLSSKRSRQF
jgi:uncharacterized coiled-coil protein SlyX